MKPDPRTDPAARKIAQARAWLLREHIWLGALALRLEPQELDPPVINCKNPKTGQIESVPVSFLATDGVSLFYNKKRCIAENVENIAGVVSHEIAHCALGHFARQGDRDRERFNVACDHAANLLLIDAGITLPAGGLADAKYKGWSAERIYIDLENNPPSPQDNKKAADGMILPAPDGSSPQQGDATPEKGDKPGQEPKDGNGDPQDGDDDGKPGQGQRPQQSPDQAEAQSLAQEWQRAAAEAAHVATARGTMPADLKRALDESRAVPQDWRELLRHFATDPNKTDYRWSPPNRRHLWRGAYLPGLRGEELGTMALFIDTSGSVYDRAEEFINEGRAMLESGIIGRLVIIACDAAAHLIGEYQRGDEINLERIPGGGGTSFKPPFEMLAEMSIEPTCAAYLTDLCGDFPDDPGYPVLWVTTEPGRAPFGTTIEMSEPATA